MTRTPVQVFTLSGEPREKPTALSTMTTVASGRASRYLIQLQEMRVTTLPGACSAQVFTARPGRGMKSKSESWNQ